MTKQKGSSRSFLLVGLVIILILAIALIRLDKRTASIEMPEGTQTVVVSKPKPVVAKPAAAPQGTVSASPLGSGWKLYKNSKLGFEVSIPSEAVVQESSQSVFFKLAGQSFQVHLNTASGALDKYEYLGVKASSVSTLSGKKASVFSIPAYGEGGEKFESAITIATDQGGYFYNLTLYGDLRISDSERKIINSFRFTK